MFGDSGELIKRGLAAERLYIASLLDMRFAEPLIAIILDYATINPCIVDAMSIKVNRVLAHHTAEGVETSLEYSIKRQGGPLLEIVKYKGNKLIRTDRTSGNDALLHVISLYDSPMIGRIYSALINGYQHALTVTYAKYDSESD